jgi:hypothetical protein
LSVIPTGAVSGRPQMSAQDDAVVKNDVNEKQSDISVNNVLLEEVVKEEVVQKEAEALAKASGEVMVADTDSVTEA